MRDTNQPLYLHIKDKLIEKIEQENLQDGDLLPTEAELGEMFNVSRTTVRSAINELTNEGYVVRQQGRGTFVANNSYEECVALLQSFHEDMLKSGSQIHSVVLALELIVPDEELLKELETEDTVLLKLQRLRYVDGDPVNITTSYLPQRVYEKIEWQEIDFEDTSLYRELKNAGIDLDHGEEVLEVGIADDLQTVLLKVEQGSPVFKNFRKVYNRAGQLIEYSRTYTRGDKYRGVVTLKKSIR